MVLPHVIMVVSSQTEPCGKYVLVWSAGKYDVQAWPYAMLDFSH